MGARTRIVILFVAAAAALVAWMSWGTIEMVWLDTRRPPCRRMADAETVSRALRVHADVVRRLVDPARGITIEMRRAEDGECRGKAWVEITYDVVATRTRIKKVLGPTFFGIPYTMANV